MDGFSTIILAAGLGKRMHSDLPKVLHKLNGKPLVQYVIELARQVGSQRIILVVGYKRGMVIEATEGMGVEYVVQEPQLGTGDAVRYCEPLLKDYNGDVLVLSGDVPLMKLSTVKSAYDWHLKSRAVATDFTFEPDDPSGYGRVVRGPKGELLRIVEHKDLKGEEVLIREVNAGIYFFKAKILFENLKSLSNNNAAGEYYITDIFNILSEQGLPLAAYFVSDPVEVAGVNSPEQLRELEQIYIKRQGG